MPPLVYYHIIIYKYIENNIIIYKILKRAASVAFINSEEHKTQKQALIGVLQK